MTQQSHQYETSSTEEAPFGSETSVSSEVPSVYFGLRHGRKHCVSCNAKTYFYFYSFMYNGKVYGWRRCGKCMMPEEREIVRALYSVLPRIYQLEYFRKRRFLN